MSATQRKALELLVEHGSASVVGGKTRVSKGGLSIHWQTAAVLIRQRYARRDADDHLTPTDEGTRRVKETDGERRARQAAEALEAQRSGKWRPAPAGASAAADSAAAEKRRELGWLHGKIGELRREISWERQSIELEREFEGSDADVSKFQSRIGQLEAEIEAVQASVDELNRIRDREGW